MKCISSIVFDRYERLKRVTIITPLGTITVEWCDVAGESCWSISGELAARLLAVPVIQRIELLFS